MAKIIAKYPSVALALIWAVLVLVMWRMPSEPRRVDEPQPTWSRDLSAHLPPGMAAVRHLIAARHRPVWD
jgi:hypothetical protein